MELLSSFFMITISTLSVLSITILFLVKNHRKHQLLPVPPSPPPKPLIGHLHLVKSNLPFQRTLQILSAKYGHVFRLKFGLRYAVVVSSPAAVEECLLKNDLIFADRPHSRAGKHLNYDSTNMSYVSYGDHFRYLRKVMNLEVFSVSRQNTFHKFRQDEIKILVKDLFTYAKDGWKRVELRTGISELTLNGILRITSGKRYYGDRASGSKEGRELRIMIKERMALSVAMSNPADLFPFLRWFIDYKNYERRLVTLRNQMDELLQGIVDEQRRNMNEGRPTKSLIDNLLTMQETNPTSLTDVTIKGIILAMVTAGTDTSSIAIEWAMALLLNNPEKLKKAQDELDTVTGATRLVEESDLPNLPFIQGIVSETLRIYPSTPLLMPHEASADCTIQGYHVPRGTMLLVNAYALHRDPKVWENPMSFKPERFANVQDSHPSPKFMPFGLGRRICPGVTMGNKIVGLAVAALVQCFDWGRVAEEAEEVDMTESPGVTMTKANALEAMCRPRDRMVHVLSQLK